MDGVWENQNGSTLELTEDEDGRLSGWFASKKGRAVMGKRFPVSGCRNGGVASFHVSWHDNEQNVHSITSFSGRLIGDQLHTVWVLAREFEDAEQEQPTGAWNAFLTNADVFTKISTVT